MEPWVVPEQKNEKKKKTTFQEYSKIVLLQCMGTCLNWCQFTSLYIQGVVSALQTQGCRTNKKKSSEMKVMITSQKILISYWYKPMAKLALVHLSWNQPWQWINREDSLLPLKITQSPAIYLGRTFHYTARQLPTQQARWAKTKCITYICNKHTSANLIWCNIKNTTLIINYIILCMEAPAIAIF